jgi:hypothetical protein
MDEQDQKHLGDNPKEERPRIPPPARWADRMDEVIEEAIRAGVFDNLPGQGKPLKLMKNPYAPETELAYQLLKDNHYTLPWISQRQEMLDQIDAFRVELSRIWGRYEAEYREARSRTIRLALATRWHRYLDSWQQQIQELNGMIANANLKQPGGKLEIMKLTLENELERVGAAKTLDSD